jgi:hypothetical protein
MNIGMVQETGTIEPLIEPFVLPDEPDESEAPSPAAERELVTTG